MLRIYKGDQNLVFNDGKRNLAHGQGIHIQQGDPKQIPMCSVQQILTDKGVSGKHHRVHGTIIFSEGSLA